MTTDLDPKEKTFFIWEGVTNYLTSEAVGATFDLVSNSAPGSKIVFTYVHSDVISEPSSFSGTNTVTRTLRDVERSGPSVSILMRCHHICWSMDLSSYPIWARSSTVLVTWAKIEGNVRGYEFYRVALAEVR